MDKYDYRILLQKMYYQGCNYHGYSRSFINHVSRILEEDKPNIKSVFGVGPYPEFELDLAIFVSTADYWKETGYCDDAYQDDTYKVLSEMGFAEQSDGIWGFPYSDIVNGKKLMSREEIIAKLTAVGFEYDEKFEQFMQDV